MSREIIIGTFVREEKNRFLCTVNLLGSEEECYIPSSCRLDNFINLEGKKVLLRKNLSSKARTLYAVYAVQVENEYMLLNPSVANEIIFSSISSRRFAFLGKRKNAKKEIIINGYKADMYLPESKTIVEIKSVITTLKKGYFPSVYSERAIDQLIKARELLSNGYGYAYIFVSLNPKVRQIEISKDRAFLEYRNLFYECVQLGMKYKAYTATIIDGLPCLKKEIPLLVSECGD